MNFSSLQANPHLFQFFTILPSFAVVMRVFLLPGHRRQPCTCSCCLRYTALEKTHLPISLPYRSHSLRTYLRTALPVTFDQMRQELAFCVQVSNTRSRVGLTFSRHDWTRNGSGQCTMLKCPTSSVPAADTKRVQLFKTVDLAPDIRAHSIVYVLPS